jgi:hypothetical protein
MYLTYKFKHKDPILHIVKTLFQIEASQKGVSFGAVLDDVATHTGVSVSTLYNWCEEDGTLSPHYKTLAAVVIYLKANVTIGQTRLVHSVKQRKAA